MGLPHGAMGSGGSHPMQHHHHHGGTNSLAGSGAAFGSGGKHVGAAGNSALGNQNSFPDDIQAAIAK